MARNAIRFFAIASRWLRVAIVIVLTYLVWVVASRYLMNRSLDERASSRAARPSAQIPGIGAGSGVQILSFYVVPAAIMEGERAILCYGVANAKSVKIEPGIGPVSPSLNRCMNVAPEHETRYSLTAAGNDGRTVTASFVLPVQVDPGKLPKVQYFTLDKTIVENNRTIYSLCYQTANAEEVRVDPPVSRRIAAFRGCFYATPDETTTYTLTAIGKKGREAQRKLTLQVP